MIWFILACTNGDITGVDNDGDGWLEGEDCNDDNPNINPGVDEVCDGIDNDCDGEINELSDLADPLLYYPDEDGDGFGADGPLVYGCYAPEGYVTTAGDCNDREAAIYPTAEERCNEVDEDCDYIVDEDPPTDGDTYYADLDSDGFGGSLTVRACFEAPDGYLEDGTDCNDASSSTYPGADERCTGEDNDCDGLIDEAPIDGVTVYRDSDEDGWGLESYTDVGCGDSAGWSTDYGDCDDGDAAVNPGADEVCNDLDDNCDGEADEVGAVDGDTYYSDLDGDGYGSPIGEVTACSQPSGYVDQAGDCNDTSATSYPGADEFCDGLDNDCDGSSDEDDALDVETWYADSDGDGYGDADTTDEACSAPSGYVSDDSDCDDSDSAVSPDATEVCDDGVDNDCDGSSNGCGWAGEIDEDDADAGWEGQSSYDYSGQAVAWAGDLDGDGTDDLIIGAYGDDDNGGESGSVYVKYGDTTAYSGSTSMGYLAKWYGEGSSDYLGYALDGVGDVDGDGYDDFVVGAYQDDWYTTNAGTAYLVYGGSSTHSGSVEIDNEVRFTGTSSYEYAGSTIAGLGDIDGDGYDDFAIGAFGGNDYRGYAHIYLGKSSSFSSTEYMSGDDATITGDDSSDGLGRANSLGTLGDMDGDGYDDYAFGAVYDDTETSQGGQVSLWYGSSSGPSDADMEDGDAIWYGEDSNGYLGWSVAGADVDGDGYSDLLMAAMYADSYRGQAYVVYGSGTALSGEYQPSDADAVLTGANTYDYFGYSISGGDLSGDGSADVVVGAYAFDSNDGGAAHIWYGPVTGNLDADADEDVLMTGGDSSMYMGMSVDLSGDMDGDGYDELIVGSYGYDSYAGAAWLLYGAGL